MLQRFHITYAHTTTSADDRTILIELHRLSHAKLEQGFTLVSVLSILIIASLIAGGGIYQGFFAEKIAGDAIQRDRAFQAADGGTILAQKTVEQMHEIGVKPDTQGNTGIFSQGAIEAEWWRNDSYEGTHTVADGTMLGVLSQPRYVVEQLGRYLSDGGTGVVSLDIGSGSYGNLSRGGKEIVLFRVETHGKGSIDETQSVIESTFAYNY